LEQYEIACKERRLEINKLNRQYIVLEELVNDFQTIMKNMSKSHKLLKTRWFVFCQM